MDETADSWDGRNKDTQEPKDQEQDDNGFKHLTPVVVRIETKRERTDEAISSMRLGILIISRGLWQTHQDRFRPVAL